MSLAKILIDDGVKTHRYNPLSFKMAYNGAKKPDTLSFSLPMNNIVAKGNTVCVLHDIVNVDFLAGLYNFHLTCKDESGYGHDPTSDPDETRFESSVGKWDGHFNLNFPDDSSNPITYTSPSNINLSKQFDIFIWFRPALDPFTLVASPPTTTTKVILWSYTDGTNGLEIGMSGTATGSGNDTNARGFVRIHDGVGTQTITGTTEKILPKEFIQSPTLIRVFRGDDNVIRMEVQGVEDGTYSTSASLQPTGATMRFGDSLGGSEYYQGDLNQVRIYRGNILDSLDAEKIRMSKPIVHVLKFKGVAWKIDDNETKKTVHCNSTSIQVLKSKLGQTGGALTTHDLSSVAFKTIFQSIIDNATPAGVNFTVKIAPGDTFARASLAGLIYEQGQTVEVMKILNILSGTVFYITPLDIVVIEDDNGLGTSYTFSQNTGAVKYNITSNASNNTKINNEVVFTGRGGIKGYGYVAPSDGTNRTLRKNVFQLDNATDLGKYADDVALILAANANLAPTRYNIKTSAYIHHVRYNHDVDVFRYNGSTDQRNNFADNINSNEIVKSIEYSYPQAQTTIMVGDNSVDQYDDLVRSNESQEGLIDTTI